MPEEAISVYLGGEQANAKEVSISIENSSALIKKSTAWIERIRLTGKNDNLYAENEQLAVDIQWASHEPMDQPLQIRVIIKYVDSSLCGTAISDAFYPGKRGLRNTTRMRIDISTLAPGKYYMTYDLLYNDQNTVQDYVNVYSLLQEVYFEKKAEQQQEVWKHNFWGNNHLPCIDTELIEL